jgi:hypothetical protein
MRRNLLKEVISVEDTCRCVLSMLHEYNTAQGYTPAGDGPSRVRQVRQRGRELGVELNQAGDLPDCKARTCGRSKPGSRKSWTPPMYSSRRWSRMERRVAHNMTTTSS